MRLQLSFLNLLILLYAVIADETKPKQKPWKKKDIRDMTEAELEHIYDEWEENDEPLEPDELPEHLRPSPPIDLSKINPSNPDEILKMTKRGKSVMMFVDLDPSISEEQAENVVRIWHSGMRNNHIIAERYPIEPRRSIFLFKEGSQVIDAKEFLLEQPELSHLTLEGQTYYNKQKSKPETKPENQSIKTKKQKKSEL